MADKRKTALGRIALLTATLLWGTSFVILKNTLNSVSTLYILAFRYTGAALLMLLIGRKELGKIDKGYVGGGVLMGLFMFIAYVFQTYGLSLTTPGKNAFLTSIYCVIVPFLYWLLVKRRPDRYNAAAALLCVAGMGLISLEGDLSIGIGDALTMIGGLFFALHIIVTAGTVGRRSVVLLSMLQFAAAAVLSWLAAFIFEPVPKNVPAGAWLSILYLCIMCTAVCYFLQLFGQKYTPPSQAAVILTFEAVFGTAISVALGVESLTPKLIIGFVLTFIAVVTSETKLSFLKKRPAGQRDIGKEQAE